jgi:hypothetical protein
MSIKVENLKVWSRRPIFNRTRVRYGFQNYVRVQRDTCKYSFRISRNFDTIRGQVDIGENRPRRNRRETT